jgi:hypothetical protein
MFSNLEFIEKENHSIHLKGKSLQSYFATIQMSIPTSVSLKHVDLFRNRSRA